MVSARLSGRRLGWAVTCRDGPPNSVWSPAGSLVTSCAASSPTFTPGGRSTIFVDPVAIWATSGLDGTLPWTSPSWLPKTDIHGIPSPLVPNGRRQASSSPGTRGKPDWRIVSLAEKAGADSVHPGYGFLAENADFAQAVIDAGLTWIGPPPAAIEALGDKAKAKHIAQKANAPLAPGTKDPLTDADEAVEFAEEFGLPIAIKAVYGGGGRGLKVARTIEEIPD